MVVIYILVVMKYISKHREREYIWREMIFIYIWMENNELSSDELGASQIRKLSCPDNPSIHEFLDLLANYRVLHVVL